VDFWGRWHITLSEFFRDYLYFPVLTSLSRRIPSLPALVLATMCSFIVMGIWHGSSSRFAIFGLVHAVGVVAALLYQRFLKRTLTRDGLERYRASRATHVVAVVGFQAFVVLSFLPFRYEARDLKGAVRAIFEPASNDGRDAPQGGVARLERSMAGLGVRGGG
jgi:D-alanyl-lipoteichoic acid acyltransferase DltB (MBOAT superfamily)